MEPHIILPFSEFTLINEFEKHFPKKEGYSVLIPSSRQQKGFDFALYNSQSGKTLTFQVKSSRTYNDRKKYKHLTWFNTFNAKEGDADYYLLFGLYVKDPEDGIKGQRVTKQKWYDHVTLIFSDKEMGEFLKNLTQKRSNTRDTKFGFGFDHPNEIKITRGAKTEMDYSGYLLNKDKIKTIKSQLSY